ncbi:outer membrane protein [Microvirga flavescens]|uniref:outer membrane protein n=1 Tax=Microvirga flavescens TaxID=2249811 RepID=UPI000DD7B54F|nr:outer membrane beta-barrel protein [Microvirga flavescens]
MKKILLAGVALVGLVGAAAAADLPARKVAPAPIVPVVPAFTWTGFYVGVNAGYGWNTNNDNVFVPGIGFVSSNNDGGFVGGGQIGYNYQIGQFVIGAETDIQYADIGGNNNNAVFVGNGAVLGFNNNSSDNYFGTVRVRAGYAFDRALIYATGGFAYGDVAGNSFSSSSNGGWTVGGGVEYAFTNNLTAKLEGLYVNLDRGNDNLLLNNVAFGNNGNTEFGVVRAGLNYKFNSY